MHDGIEVVVSRLPAEDFTDAVRHRDEFRRVPGAPRLGEVSLAGSSIPLIGVQADPSTFTDPSCPSLFPDSVLR